MSDLFHDDVPFEYIDRVFEVMWNTPWHTYQVLTKRPARMREYMCSWDFSGGDLFGPRRWQNVWVGTSVEDRRRWDERVPILKDTPNARVRFLSIEPLLEGLGEIDLEGVDWVIVGGESGDGYRQMDGDWAREIRDQCAEQKVHFFFKQWGGFPKSKQGRLLDGVEHNDWPVVEQSHVTGLPMPVRS